MTLTFSVVSGGQVVFQEKMAWPTASKLEAQARKKYGKRLKRVSGREPFRFVLLPEGLPAREVTPAPAAFGPLAPSSCPRWDDEDDAALDNEPADTSYPLAIVGR